MLLLAHQIYKKPTKSLRVLYCQKSHQFILKETETIKNVKKTISTSGKQTENTIQSTQMAKHGRKVKISQMLEHRATQNNGLESHSQGEMRPNQGTFHSSELAVLEAFARLDFRAAINLCLVCSILPLFKWDSVP